MPKTKSDFLIGRVDQGWVQLRAGNLRSTTTVAVIMCIDWLLEKQGTDQKAPQRIAAVLDKIDRVELHGLQSFDASLDRREQIQSYAMIHSFNACPMSWLLPSQDDGSSQGAAATPAPHALTSLINITENAAAKALILIEMTIDGFPRAATGTEPRYVSLAEMQAHNQPPRSSSSRFIAIYRSKGQKVKKTADDGFPARLSLRSTGRRVPMQGGEQARDV